MIDLPDPPARLRFETLLPLIDVVFFLVIAFMMISQITTARPFDVALPQSSAPDRADGRFTLYLSSDGTPGYVAEQVLTGEAALAALAVARADHCARADCATRPPVVQVAADAAAPAAGLAALLPVLAAMGFGSVLIVTAEG
jgi:biopolymer transport protein ExbD